MTEKNAVLFKKSTQYGQILVRNELENGEWVRYLRVNERPESAMYCDPEKLNELVFPYMRYFVYALSARPEIRRTLLIGGGGFAYPRYYLEHYPDREITVAEISPDIVEISRQWFGLKKLEAQKDRFQLWEGNGFSKLAASEEKFDLIINDAFQGGRSIGRRGGDTACIAEHLNPGGIYMVNVITAETGLFSLPGKLFASSVRNVLPYTILLGCGQDDPQIRPTNSQNCLLLASDREL